MLNFLRIYTTEIEKETYMNPVLEAIKTRRSIRKFKPDMVEQNIIDQIVEAGLYAASGMNKQSTKIIVIKNKDLRDKLSAEKAKIDGRWDGADPFYGAPVILVVLTDKNQGTCVYDGSLVMGNLMLAAHALNIGSCWIHRAKETFEQPEYKELLKSLKIEGDWEGIGYCILGYIDGESPKILPRKENRVYQID